MGLIELALTITAWRKGWGVRALLPMAGTFAAAFLAGAALAAGGGAPADLRPLGLLFDFAGIAALVYMTRQAPAGSSKRGSNDGLAVKSAA